MTFLKNSCFGKSFHLSIFYFCKFYTILYLLTPKAYANLSQFSEKKLKMTMKYVHSQFLKFPQV